MENSTYCADCNAFGSNGGIRPQSENRNNRPWERTKLPAEKYNLPPLSDGPPPQYAGIDFAALHAELNKQKQSGGDSYFWVVAWLVIAGAAAWALELPPFYEPAKQATPEQPAAEQPPPSNNKKDKPIKIPDARNKATPQSH